MPAVLDDPMAPAIYRVSGQAPFPEPYGPLPDDISLRQVTLRDRVTTATLIPFSSPHHVPPHLTAYLCELLNREIEKGDTYPIMEPMPLSAFALYWFANFGAVMIMGDIHSVQEVAQMEERGVDWTKECLGSFYVKPNYPGRSSHVCNGGFLVTDAARNRGVGRLMGECYLEWAPKLGYSYSVFNLVYETNLASLRIWDALGFKRIGKVKGCGNLKSYPDQLVDAIIFGRELGGEGDDYATEERFDKIRFYLRTGSYPTGSDRAEKSRLRSAATHYRLVPGKSGDNSDDKLMLKGKEVISDPHKQYEIARNMHASTHGGINKTTAGIAEKYHWVRIKETVSAAIRNCSECKDTSTFKVTPTSSHDRRGPATATNGVLSGSGCAARRTATAAPDPPAPDPMGGATLQPHSHPTTVKQHPAPVQQRHIPHQMPPRQHPHVQEHLQHPPPPAPMGSIPYHDGMEIDYGDMPVDPQIMHGIHEWDPSGPTHMTLHDGTEAKPEDLHTINLSLRAELEAQIAHEEASSFVRVQRNR